MKKVALLMVFVLVATCLAVAPALADEGAKMKMKNTHDMTVELISADAKARTITIKDEKGEAKTVPVMGAAVKELNNLKGGEKVTITCLDNDKGEHQGVTQIKVAMAKK